MFQLPFLDKKVKEDPKNLLDKEEGEKPKRDRKKKELIKPWTSADRLIVGGVLLATVLLGIYFWYRGQGEFSTEEFDLNLSWPSFEEKIILE